MLGKRLQPLRDQQRAAIGSANCHEANGASPEKPTARAAAGVTSITRPRMNGPRSGARLPVLSGFHFCDQGETGIDLNQLKDQAESVVERGVNVGNGFGSLRHVEISHPAYDGNGLILSVSLDSGRCCAAQA